MKVEIKGHILESDEFTDRDIFSFTSAMDMACGVRMMQIWLPQINQALRQKQAEMQADNPEASGLNPLASPVEFQMVEYASRQDAERDLIYLLGELFGELPAGFLSQSGKRLLLSTPELLQIWTAMSAALLPSSEVDDSEEAELRARLAEIEEKKQRSGGRGFAVAKK